MTGAGGGEMDLHEREPMSRGADGDVRIHAAEEGIACDMRAS